VLVNASKRRSITAGGAQIWHNSKSFYKSPNVRIQKWTFNVFVQRGITVSDSMRLSCCTFGNTYSGTTVIVFASRIICQRPPRFSKTERECPAIRVAGSPFLGEHTRVVTPKAPRLLHQHRIAEYRTYKHYITATPNVLTVAEHLYFDQSTLKNSKTFSQLKGESSEASILSLLCAIYQHRAK